jgi:hypothetical protein
MSKKVQPDPKTRTIKHINGTKADSKAMADAKKQEPVDVKWESTPSWTVMSNFSTNNDTKDYFGKVDNEGDE